MRTFSIAYQATFLGKARTLGVYAWSDRELRYFPTKAEEWQPRVSEVRRAAAAYRELTTPGERAEFFERGFEIWSSGYQSVSLPETVEATCLNDAARRAAAATGLELVVPACPHGLGVGPKLRALYPRYSSVLDITCELLLRANTADHALYVDVRGPADWADGMATVWVAADSDDRASAFRIGPAGELPTAEEIAQRAGFPLADACQPPGPRFATWAWMFAAARRVVARQREPWCLSTVFHGGWGTYYIDLQRLGEPGRFAVSEAGHLALPTSVAPADADGAFDLRRRAQESPHVDGLADYLLRGLEAAGVAAGGQLDLGAADCDSD